MRGIAAPDGRERMAGQSGIAPGVHPMPVGRNRSATLAGRRQIDSSSSPSSPATIIAPFGAEHVPAPRHRPAQRPGAATPTSCRVTPAGLASGPIRLKIVRRPSALRIGAMRAIAGWCVCANRKQMPRSASVASAIARWRGQVRGPALPACRRRPPCGCRAVAVLGDRNPASRDDDRHGGGDVEAVLAVAAGAADVDGACRAPQSGSSARASRCGGAGDFDGGFAALGERDQECGDFRVRASRRRACRPNSASASSATVLTGGYAASSYPADRSQEIGKHGMAMFGGDAFGVELDAVDRQRCVAETHDVCRRRWWH